MHIIRYLPPGSDTAAVGMLVGDRITCSQDVADLASLWQLPVADLRGLLSASTSAAAGPALGEVMVLPPVDGRTVWARGVTYEISRAARVEESRQSADVYERVYDAPRPELGRRADRSE